ncbi:MAG TPA: hypothetical protein VM100_04165, partial [Longimicrobiales bacterium]|nr:hypothetical protein [Longimicrobiales bacterium]
LLTATFRGVRVGDLAASSFFNSEFGVGDVQPHPYLFYTLFEACYLVALAERLTKRTGSQPYFAMTPEPSYTSAAAYRCFYKCGAAAIDVYQRCHVIAVVPPTNSPPANGPTLNSVPRPARQLSPESRTRVEQYFKLRLSSAAKVLAHMRYGENDNTARELVDYEGNPASLTEDRVHCAIFLHSFADAQYYYGLDGFDSLSHWLFHSIDACLVNKGIATVVIKPHPSETYRGMHTDAVILREIMQRYGSNERVLLLHPKASLTRLCSSAPLVGITNHGSVAEELVYLGQPVIASVFAPWGEHYRFARLWKTQEQYDELIKSINPDSWTPPTEEEKEELVHFILDQRVCELPSDRRLPRRILALLESRAGVQAGAPAPNDDHAQHLMGLDNLRLDDARLAALLREFEKLPAFIPPAVLQHRPRA